MDKLKKVFSPGSKKDDEILYGDAEERRASATTGISQQPPEQLHAVEGADKKEPGILSQVLNPGGDKYDETRFGTTATTQEPEREPGKLYTDPDTAKDRSIARQILNPNNDKYDEQRFSETAATEGDRKNSVPTTEAPPVAGSDVQLQTDSGKKDRSILRQILNPHGDKHDEQGYGTTAHAVSDKEAQRSDVGSNITSTQGTAVALPRQQGHATPASALSLKSGVEGPFARHADSPSAGAGSAQQSLPDRTATTATTTTTTTATSAQPLDNPSQSTVDTTDDTHYGRDAAIAGGGLAAAGGAGYAATRSDKPEEKITDRPHPLSEKAAGVSAPSATAQSASAGIDSTASEPHSVGPAGGAHINPVGAPEESLTSGGSSHIERDVLVGAGAAGATGEAASSQINTAPSDVQSATYTERAYPVGSGYHHTTGPHQTDIANILDPHVPGEFPAEGSDKPGLENPPLGSVVAEDKPSATSDATSQTTSSEKKSVVGTIASAVGLGGLVGGAAGKERSEEAAEPAESTAATTHPGGESYPIQTAPAAVPSAPAGAEDPSTSRAAEPAEKSGEHHYGRDAGIAAGAAGAGAAGYGAYEATKDRDATPATADTSDTARQTPQQAAPATTTTNTTTTTTATTSKADEPSTTTADQPDDGKHHYGRDAAVAGGDGAAGYGAYEATKDSQDTGPASKTIGPHESNVANIVDPRVQPDLEKQKQKQSDPVASQSSDPSDPAKASEEKNYSRDAAIAGGAGVAGAGVVATTRYEDTENGRAPTTSETTAASTSSEPPAAIAQKSREAETQQTAAQAQQPQEGGHTVYILDEPTSLEPIPPKDEVAKDEQSTSKKQQTSHDKDSSEKEEGEEKEKKHGLLHKILHPGSSKKEKKDEEESKEPRKSTDQQPQTQRVLHQAPPGSLNHPLVTSEDIDNRISTDEKGHNKLHKKAVPQPGVGDEGLVTEPHTGLPMNVGKYGTGQGGTDGAEQISGYREGAGQEGEGVAGPDWDAIKKANTPY